MTRRTAVRQPPLDNLGPSEGNGNMATDASPAKPQHRAEDASQGLNKDLPLNPAERAGLQAQKRHYTKELEAHKPPKIDPNHAYPNVDEATTLILTGMKPMLDIKCGPLLRYVHTDYTSTNPMASYTIMVVAVDSKSDYSSRPRLAVAGINTEDGRVTLLKGTAVHKERGLTFWRWKIDLYLIEQERRLSYNINGSKEDIGFWVPASNQTMRIMFHSCNGFSQSVEPHHLSGPDPLWSDVLRQHQKTPFHVMLGGGDQIYNDGISKTSKLFKAWLQISNLHHKFSTPYTTELADELEACYLSHYCEVCLYWSQLTSSGSIKANLAMIPMINIYDDHDIIDGFGSYPSRFMLCPVFSNLGRVAHKYYLLFQHLTAPEEDNGWDKSIVFGAEPGPYMKEYSRSVATWLGKDVFFLGLDNRTERTQYRVNFESTYEKIMARLKSEIAKGETKHLIVMLGVPIAYPRLVWLENLLTSRIMAPVKLLARMGMFGGLLNNFDRGIEILDDLDDHWSPIATCFAKVQERNWLVKSFQDIALSKSVRVTFLGGDVHLGAIGQFYSKKALNIAPNNDHRYMVISSAIVNTPPSETVGDLLHRRNKVHHLDSETDEDMVPIFQQDVDGKPLNNKHLLPRRNWCGMNFNQTTGASYELEVVLNVEINCKDPQGLTKGYRITIPTLNV